MSKRYRSKLDNSVVQGYILNNQLSLKILKRCLQRLEYDVKFSTVWPKHGQAYFELSLDDQPPIRLDHGDMFFIKVKDGDFYGVCHSDKLEECYEEVPKTHNGYHIDQIICDDLTDLYCRRTKNDQNIL